MVPDVEDWMLTEERVSEPVEREKRVQVSEAVVIEKSILLTVRLAPTILNTTVLEFRLSNCFVCDPVSNSGLNMMDSEINGTDSVSGGCVVSVRREME